jgi:TPR repeat protein
MKSIVIFILAALLCSSPVFAETTLELLQQRAAAGDATAQTFLGMAYQYGYEVSPDPAAAQQWFAKAAEQGDEFAAKRRDFWGQSIRTTVRVSTDLRSMSPEEFQKKIELAASAPYAGDITFDELVLKRDQYIGKVIELNFTAVSAVGGSVPYIYIRDPRSYGSQGGASDRLYLYGEPALKWRLEVERKAPGATSTVCALVEKEELIALGSRKRKLDDGYTYSW